MTFREIAEESPVVSPSGPAVLPAPYLPYSVSGFGVTARLPVPPADWSIERRTFGVDFGDPSGRVLLRIEIRELTGESLRVSARRAWEIAEPDLSRRLAGYRRLGIAEVPGPGDSAADLSFTFDRDGCGGR